MHDLERFLSLSISLAMAIYEMGWEKYEEVLSPRTRVGWRIPPRVIREGVKEVLDMQCEIESLRELKERYKEMHDSMKETMLYIFEEDDVDFICELDDERKKLIKTYVTKVIDGEVTDGC